MNLIIFSALAGVVMMLSGVFVHNKRSNSAIALVAILVMLVMNTLELRGYPLFNIALHGMLRFDTFGMLLNEILLIVGVIYFLLSGPDIEKVGDNVPDYYALIFFVFCGVGIVTAYQSLLMLFLGIEIISIPLYILTASDKPNLKSVEASLKYFLMGSFSTGIMLMGIALVYGGTGSFAIEKMQVGQVPLSYNLVAGLLLLLASMCFKVSAAPFHFWTPDVYDGAPMPFTSFMATIVKVACFVAFIKLFEGSAGNIFHKWQIIISFVIACTLLIGNITAVFQQSVKRMLAYSSIAQAGFMLFALFAFNQTGKEALVLYAAAYCLATIGIFAILGRMEDYTFNGFNGLAKREPLLAFVNTVFFLSLAGIPLTAGFFGKYYMIANALQYGEKFLWLFIVAMLCAAISVYYYFRVIQAMYFKSGEGEPVVASSFFKYVLVGVAALIVVLGINPQWLLQYLYF
jgi:NADH-quinone oxidoreductase subunit N